MERPVLARSLIVNTLRYALCAASLLAASLCPTAALAQSDGLEGAHGWSRSHMFGMGSRLTGRIGTYALGGVGGHLRLRPIRWIAVEAFTDHVFGSVDNALRHDHEGGVSLQFPFVGNRWWNVYPLVGACASLVVLESPRQGGAFVTDIHFGVRGGLGSELYLTDRWALRAQVEGIGYIGHDLRAYDWTAQLSPDVRVSGVAQAVLSINLYL